MGIIRNFATETLTVSRFATGTNVKGVYVPGAITPISVIASVQPLSNSEILRLPEGERNKKHIKLYTEVKIYTSDEVDSKNADRFVWRGDTYEVSSNLSWINTDIEHYKTIATMIDKHESDRQNEG